MQTLARILLRSLIIFNSEFRKISSTLVAVVDHLCSRVVGMMCCFSIYQINSTLLALIVRVFLKLKSNAKSGEWQRTKRAVRAIVLLTPLLGITWIFGALAIDENTKWFLYLFSICNSLQVRDQLTCSIIYSIFFAFICTLP